MAIMVKKIFAIIHVWMHKLLAARVAVGLYLAEALPREPIRIVRGQPEQTVAWPKHGIFIQSEQRSALTGEETGVQFSSKVSRDPQ